MNIEELILKITELKQQLIDIVRLKGSFTDTEVVEMSQELDVALNLLWKTDQNSARNVSVI